MRDVEQSLGSRGIKIDLAGLQPWEDPQVWEMIAQRRSARGASH